ncbi:hypothetical protein [Nocardioides litoris]|uniref:hypothetical protein n=1 Tax=Nocardioides litoris TaxID=1926648 RepID=UPI00111F919C|nr:hypothetical protein [Nocardioides litoris]
MDDVDLVLLPLPDADRDEPLRRDAVVEHLGSRRLCGATLGGERIGVLGAVVVRLALHDAQVLAVDPDGTVHPGPQLGEVVLGLAHRVGAVVQVADVVVDQHGDLLDEERVLAGVARSPRSTVVSAWRDDDLLLARMTAAELGAHASAWLVDGWAVVAWDDGASAPDAPLAFPARQHPVASVGRAGDLRSVQVAPAPGADVLEVTWAPPLTRVLDVPPGSAADAVLGALEGTVAHDDPDDWPAGFEPGLRPRLQEAQRGSGDDFLATVARLLWLPPVVAGLAEHGGTGVRGGPSLPVRIGDGTAHRLAWEHVRTPAPETEAERRLRAQPRRTIVRQVATNLLLAAAIVALVLSVDLRFVPEWLLWAMAAFAAFNAVSTWWFWRSGQH